jgi:hypothetical protein
VGSNPATPTSRPAPAGLLPFPAPAPSYAPVYLERRITAGNTMTEALRALERRLSDVVCRSLLADAQPAASATQLADAA